MSPSAIEWTDATWNPVTGCDRVSPGCAHCYALELAPKLRRFAAARGTGKWLGVRDGGAASGPAFGVTLHPQVLEEPLRWRRPRMVFVNSMSDLFHEAIPDEFIARVFAVMAHSPQHTFQVLTKRPDRMRDLLGQNSFGFPALVEWTARDRAPIEYMPWPLPNVWLGTSIENRRFVGRADVLRETPAAVRFISAEPLLGPLLEDDYDCWQDDHEGPGLTLNGIDWLIVGGESGPDHRPVHPEWVRALRDATRLWADDEVTQLPGRHCAFFFKQWGGRTPKSGGRELDGRTWDELPPRAGTLGQEQVHVNARTVLWHAREPVAMALGWEGDDG